jgi:hypothetical protein
VTEYVDAPGSRISALNLGYVVAEETTLCVPNRRPRPHGFVPIVVLDFLARLLIARRFRLLPSVFLQCLPPYLVTDRPGDAGEWWSICSHLANILDMLNNGTPKIGDVRVVERNDRWDVERFGDPADAADPNDPPEWVCLRRCDTQAEAETAAATYRGLI